MPDGTALELQPRPCGTGCATLGLELPSGVSRLQAEAHAKGWTGGTTTLRLDWPPPAEDPELFERMRRTMLSAGEVVVLEAFDADPDPDENGPSMDGAALVQLMPWAGGGVTDVRPVPGEPDRFTFYLPGSFTWFDVTVDDQDRLIRQRLVNAGHDIRYRFRYGPPDEPPPPADT